MSRLLLLLAVLGCAGDGTNASEGKFSFAWELTDNGQTIDCAAAGVETIQIVTNNGVATTEMFLCDDDRATTGPRDVGDYTIVVNALDGADGLVATSSDQGEILGGQTTDLGVFPLEIAEQVCDSSTCPTGCCDENGACVDPQTDMACGRSGVACVDCSGLGQVCNATEGLCID